jgi:hypothetical protein
VSAPQRVNPASIRKANRAGTVADVATALIWVSLAAVAVGLLANVPPLPAVGLLVGVPAVGVSILAAQLADRYRELDGGEDRG